MDELNRLYLCIVDYTLHTRTCHVNSPTLFLFLSHPLCPQSRTSTTSPSQYKSASHSATLKNPCSPMKHYRLNPPTLETGVLARGSVFGSNKLYLIEVT